MVVGRCNSHWNDRGWNALFFLFLRCPSCICLGRLWPLCLRDVVSVFKRVWWFWELHTVFFPAPHSKPIRQQWLLINAHMFLLMSIQHLIDAKVVLLILFPRAIFTRYWYELFKKLPLKSETPTTSIDWQRYGLLYEDNFKNNNMVALEKNMLMEHQHTHLCRTCFDANSFTNIINRTGVIGHVILSQSWISHQETKGSRRSSSSWNHNPNWCFDASRFLCVMQEYLNLLFWYA